MSCNHLFRSSDRPSSNAILLVATALITYYIALTSALAGDLRALCSAAKDLVSSGKAQEGILIADPTPKDLAKSTLTYATAKRRYVAELRSVMPIIIAIGLKRRPEDTEVAEFRLVFEQFGEDDEKRVDKATIQMLERFNYDKSVETAEQEFKKAQEVETSLLKEYVGLNAT